MLSFMPKMQRRRDGIWKIQHNTAQLIVYSIVLVSESNKPKSKPRLRIRFTELDLISKTDKCGYKTTCSCNCSGATY